MATLYGALSVRRFQRFTVNSWDNAIFEQALQGYASFSAPIVAIKGPGYNILGDHFSPIYVLIAPFYRLFPTGETLLIAQAVLIGLSVSIMTAAALRLLGPTMGGIVAAAYALSFGLQAAVVVDFHEVAFAPPLLAMAGVAYLDRRWNHVVFWTLLLFLVKEDMGVTVAAVGVVLWLSGQRRRGIVLGAIGLIGTLLVVAVIIPFFNNSDGYDYVSNLGGDQGVLTTLFTEVWRKLLTFIVTFAITGFAALLSPWAIVAVPTFAWRFTGDVDYYWGTEWHYSITLMPVVFIAMIDVIRRLRDERLVTPWGPAISDIWANRLQWSACGLAALVTSFMLATSPLMQLFEAETWLPAERASAANAAMVAVAEIADDDTVVESDLGLLTHLVSDHEVYWRGTVGDVVPDIIVFDDRYSSDHPIDYGLQRHGENYELVFSQDGYTVVRLDR